MNLAPKKGQGLEDSVKLTLTQRDILLLKLCLELVDRDYTRGGALRFDIQGLQTRLAQYHSAPSISRKKQAGCGEECRCASHENRRKADE